MTPAVQHALVEIDDLVLTFGKRRILDIPRLEIETGKLLLLTGPNGSGKTSLLKVLAGLLIPKYGRVFCLGQAMGWRRAARFWRGKHIYLHQHPYLFDGTVADNVAYGLRLQGRSREQRAIEVRSVLEWARLDHLHDRPAYQLSSGEQQRVALVRAHVLNPAVLLLDEITANLDEQSREQTIELVRNLISAGTSIVVASHEPKYIEDVSDAHLRLDEGRAVSAAASATVIPLTRQRND
jgi:energy-coupling factor transporter ATP-binding protein EcfA2